MTNHEGLAIGHEMAEIAADNAGTAWKEDAYHAFLEYARTHGEFTTEQVRLANHDIPSPPDDRAWGGVALRAKREGLVVAVGWTRATSRSVHGMVVTQWKAKV